MSDEIKTNAQESPSTTTPQVINVVNKNEGCLSGCGKWIIILLVILILAGCLFGTCMSELAKEAMQQVEQTN